MFTAFLPMKYKSERVINKNFRTIKGKPLFFYILETLSSIELIEEIVIDFDNKKVEETVKKFFNNITFVERSKNLSDPYESVNNLIKDNLKNFKNNYIIQTHVTNPLLRKNTIEDAMNKYLAEKNPLFSVTKYQSRFYDSRIKPINHKLDELLPTQHLPPVYEENSNFYIFSKKQFKEAESRVNKNSVIFEIPILESIDIDTEEDFGLVKKLLES